MQDSTKNSLNVEAWGKQFNNNAIEPHGEKGGASLMTFTLTSSAFKEGTIIPNTHTCSGQDISPPLQWNAPPKDTQSFALIMDDPDAPIGTWVHWVMFNIPGHTFSLPEGVPSKKSLPAGEQQGINDFKRIGYGGPCPPPGKSHRYYFKLFALDSPLE